ncbi:MAG: hypothetical protein HRU19_26190 [Pseudobacteriovorax sp.]|nr:hypothetical protein [Pseudobacteriovorax sp.]
MKKQFYRKQLRTMGLIVLNVLLVGCSGNPIYQKFNNQSGTGFFGQSQGYVSAARGKVEWY